MHKDDDGAFELIREEVPFHECGHYHATLTPCPDARSCTSTLCCVFAGDTDQFEY